jgi:hypothetical protein
LEAVVEDRNTRTTSRRLGAALLTVGLALSGFSVFAPEAFADKPADVGNPNDQQGGGNNGTVKIREAGTADEDVSNDPHIDCLEAAWYGFDDTADVATFDVTFVNPTAAVDVQHFADQITLQADAAGGSADFDGSFQPAIDTTGIDAKNGEWHVTVDIETTTANGSIIKSKTVWLSNDCGDEGGPTDPQTAQATIEVGKVVVGTTAQATFPFSVSCTTGTVTGSPLTVAVGGSSTATVTWDAAGTAPSCTVTETNTHGATATTWSVEGGAATTGTAASTGALTDGDTTDVDFTNTYVRTGCTANCGPVVVIDTPPVVDTPAPLVLPAVVEAPPAEVPPAPAAPPAQVAAVQVVSETPAAAVMGAELARTGAMTDRLLLAAGLCLLLGGLAMVASKERAVVVAPTRRR